jgi:hypothetical protein
MEGKMTKRTFIEKKEFASGIDLRPLIEKVAEVLGHKDLVFQTSFEINERDEEIQIYLCSQDIKDKCGLFGDTCEYVKVHTWHGNVREIEETGKLRVYWDFKLTYKFHNGGMNGNYTDIDAFYDEGKGFTIRKNRKEIEIS